MIAYQSAGNYGHIYLKIVGTALSLHQQSSTFSATFFSFKHSPNGSHFLALAPLNSVYLYAYDNTTTSFTLLFNNSLYPSSIWPLSMYLYYGDFFSVGCA